MDKNADFLLPGRKELYDKSKFWTVNDAAKHFGCSRDTVIRRIRAGKINAVATNATHGTQYFIPVSEINVSPQVIDVVPVEKNVSIDDLSNVFSEAISSLLVPAVNELKERVSRAEERAERAEKALHETQEQLNALLETNATNSDALSFLKTQNKQNADYLHNKLNSMNEDLDKRDIQLVSQMRQMLEPKEKKSWWHRIFQ